jgi:hypothetical protein
VRSQIANLPAEKAEAQTCESKVEWLLGKSREETMAKKPAVDEASLLLELYDLRREPELLRGA